MIRCSNSCAFNPAYCQTMLTTGMLMLGKISVGVRRSTKGVSKSNTSAQTTKVYGRRSAKRTIHITFIEPECPHPPERVWDVIPIVFSRALFSQFQKMPYFV